MSTIRHFLPDLNRWLADLPDSRHQPFVYYPAGFLSWVVLAMYLFELGSRREVDFSLRDDDSLMLDNLNRLAGTGVEAMPVHDTLAHYLGHVGSTAFGQLRTRIVQDLIRRRVLDSCRLHGRLVVAIDGTGYLSSRRRHCDRCLTQRHGETVRYLHHVLEAKIVGDGLAISAGSEFIENPPGYDSDDYQHIRQDCELKAFYRLAVRLKHDYPRTRLCLSGDSLFACGPVLGICRENTWSFVLTLKPDAMPAVWQDVQDLLRLAPENKLHLELPDVTRDYRWVNDVAYTDSDDTDHTFSVIILTETRGTAKTTFSWITDRRLNANNIDLIATNGGRKRWNIENQGFNTQKNSGLNLGHLYSHDNDILKSFYHLMQIAHLIGQLFQASSLLRAIAAGVGRSVIHLFGSRRNITRRLLETFRGRRIPDDAFDPDAARRLRVSLDTS